MNRQPEIHNTGRTFRFSDHPWLSLATFLVLSVVVLGISGTVLFRIIGLPEHSRFAGFLNSTVSHLIILFILVPFALGLPKGRRPFAAYTRDIGLTRIRPAGRLLLIALSCYIILALSQALGSIVFRLTQHLPISAGFLRQVFDVSGDLPARSGSLLYSLPSAFEEIGWRGVMVTLFLAHYSKRSAVLIAAVAFALLHLLNLASGREAIWVAGQLGWAFMMGVFYGYLFLQTGSLLPPMLVHYLSNAFVGSFAGYMQSQATMGLQVLYGMTFSFGIVPVTLMLLWIKVFTGRWPFPYQLKRESS